MAMRSDPRANLTKQELDRLGSFLEGCNGGRAMSLEELDGFFCALVVGPSLVLPSEYYPEIFGKESSRDAVFADLKEANEILKLLMGLWNEIAGTLLDGHDYVPIIYEYEDGSMPANDWAVGFHRGVRMRRGEWMPLIEDEELRGLLAPMLALSLEHGEDPELRPEKPLSAEERGRLIGQMANALLPMYRFFRERQRAEVAKAPAKPVSKPKLGRNEPCPCGSGKKYKKCCGAESVH